MDYQKIQGKQKGRNANKVRKTGKKKKKASAAKDAATLIRGTPEQFGLAPGAIGMRNFRPSFSVKNVDDDAIVVTGTVISNFEICNSANLLVFGALRDRASGVNGIPLGSFNPLVRFENPAGRLQAIATGYEYYEWEEMVLHYVPCRPTSDAGSFVFGISWDPIATIPTGSTAGITCSQYIDTTSTTVWMPQSLRVKCPKRTRDKEPHYNDIGVGTDGEIRMNFACAMLGGFLTLPSAAFNTILGQIHVEYRIRLWKPILNTGTTLVRRLDGELGGLSADQLCRLKERLEAEEEKRNPVLPQETSVTKNPIVDRPMDRLNRSSSEYSRPR